MTTIRSGHVIQATGIILSFLASTFPKIFANEYIMIGIQRQGPRAESDQKLMHTQVGMAACSRCYRTSAQTRGRTVNNAGNGTGLGRKSVSLSFPYAISTNQFHKQQQLKM